MTRGPSGKMPPKDGSRPERPTQKTIARITGLAIPTISRALADAPDISAETKRRVREVAARIGYRPDRAGVRLRTGRTNVIALLLSTDHDMMNHTARLISSIAAELRGSPYHMIITPYFPSEDPMDPVRYLAETRSADGLILNQTTPQDPRVDYLMRHQIPFATHGRTDWCAEHPYFDFDNAAFARLAVEELHRRGRRNVAIILPPAEHNYSRHLAEGAAAGAARTGAGVQPVAGASSDDPASQIAEAVGAHLRRHPSTDAVICASPASAMATVSAAEGLGLTIGEDLDIAAKEAIEFLKAFRAPILTMTEDVARAGRFLARATMQRITRPDLPPMQELDVPGRFG